jgi:phage tail fibre protein|nr:MAG TPA: Baseplate wedge protein [Caudoviricetes sp.]
MAHFAKIQTTQQGKNIILAGQNKQSVVFTKVELGDGLLDEGQSVDDMTALVHSVMSLPLQNFVNNGDGTARLRFVLDNNNLSKGFFNREIGVFARVGDGTEQLFAYTNAGNLADYIPGKESPISSKIINLHIIVGNAANLTIVAENSAYVTKLDMDGHKTQEVLDHPDGSVTTPKIRDEAVTGAKIAQASIEKKHLKKRGISAGDVGAYSKGETDEKITAHRTAAELDHPEKSVHKKHLHQDVYESPALTGTPTAPTAGRGTNDGQIASTAFVVQAIAALVNSAPGALDTLQELAAALGNDANFAATVTNALAGKLGKTEIATRAAELVGWSLERNRAYSVGDVAYHRSLPSWARLECVKAGTTAGSLPSLAAINRCGVMVTDGSVVWIVDDLRDGTPVGVVRGSLYVPAGYVKANGATVQRADYPRLVALADRYSLWTSDVPRDPGLFGRADHNTVMVLPNWIDRMVQLSECNNGTEYGKRIDAGLPNIMGTFAFQDDNATQSQGYGFARVHSATGAFRGIKRESWHRMLSANAITDEEGDSSIEFNAALNNPIYGRSNTVQPSAIQLIPIIKY